MKNGLYGIQYIDFKDFGNITKEKYYNLPKEYVDKILSNKLIVLQNITIDGNFYENLLLTISKISESTSTANCFDSTTSGSKNLACLYFIFDIEGKRIYVNKLKFNVI